jgi:hypothetical protein
MGVSTKRHEVKNPSVKKISDTVMEITLSVNDDTGSKLVPLDSGDFIVPTKKKGYIARVNVKVTNGVPQINGTPHI